jgi:hypothetical protein
VSVADFSVARGRLNICRIEGEHFSMYSILMEVRELYGRALVTLRNCKAFAMQCAFTVAVSS